MELIFEYFLFSDVNIVCYVELLALGKSIDNVNKDWCVFAVKFSSH